MDAKEKLQFLSEITKEFYLVSRSGFSNAVFHLNNEHIGMIMKEYASCHDTNESFFSEFDFLDDKEEKVCDCIVFNLQSDFYRFLVKLEEDAKK